MQEQSYTSVQKHDHAQVRRIDGLSVAYAIATHALVLAIAYAFNAIHAPIAHGLTSGVCCVSVAICLAAVASRTGATEVDLFWTSVWIIINTGLISGLYQVYFFPHAEPGLVMCVALAAGTCVASTLSVALLRRRSQ